MKSIQDDGRARDTNSDYPDERTNRHGLAKRECAPMIIKAIICVAAVWMFMPREPDVGFGNPGNSGQSYSSIGTDIACKALDMVGAPCNPIAVQAATAPDTIEQVRASFLERLQRVKADLRAARR
jgi:hypothetical protein